MARKGGVDRGIVEKPKGSGVWWVRWFENRRERWERCTNKSQARDRYAKIRVEIREGRRFDKVVRRDTTLAAWIQRCLAGSANQNVINERLYGRRWTWLIGKRLLTEIDTDTLRQIQRKMQTKLRPRPANAPPDFTPKRRWANPTVNRHVSYLKHVLMLALKDGLIGRNPAVGIKALPETSTTRFLSEAEILRLRGVMDPTDWKIVALAIETAMRRSELFGLRWRDIDLESGVIALALPKGGRSRYVPLSEEAKRILRTFDSAFTSAWVFPAVVATRDPEESTDDSRPMDSRAWLRRAFEPALRKAGLAGTGVSFHKLRHTGASRRIAAGADLVSVKEILGHVSVQTTMRYSHVANRHLQKMVNLGSLSETGTTTGSTGPAPHPSNLQPLDFVVRPAGIEPATLSLEG